MIVLPLAIGDAVCSKSMFAVEIRSDDPGSTDDFWVDSGDGASGSTALGS